MNECSRRHHIPLRSRATGEAARVQDTPAGADFLVTSCAGETVAVWEDGSMWADVPSPAENGAGGRKRICWLSGTDAYMGAAHLNNKNAPIIILVLFLFN